jgi:hypothetical protein
MWHAWEKNRNSYKILVGNPRERDCFKTKCRSQGNIKMDLTESGQGMMIGLFWLRIRSSVWLL